MRQKVTIALFFVGFVGIALSTVSLDRLLRTGIARYRAELREPTEQADPRSGEATAGRRGLVVLPRRLFRVLPIVVVGVGACGALLLWYLRRQGRIARGVIEAIHQGDLQARMPAGKLAMAGGLVQAFNRMADDIQGLVDKLRAVEVRRVGLVQELAHDIRTPLSSVRLHLDAMKRGDVPLSPAAADGVVAIQRELAYLQRLLDSLLVLAQLDEPDFAKPAEPIDLRPLVLQECLLAGDRPDFAELAFRFEENGPAAWVGAEPTLVARAVRNLLENAGRFARRQVDVTLLLGDGGWSIVVRDDGPGFPPQALSGYGTRRHSRVVDPGTASHISVGLGAAIVVGVARRLGGAVVARNHPDGGAEITLRLPAAFPERFAA